MHKKILAMLLAGSMVMSSSAVVMAAESEAVSEEVVSEEATSEEAASEEAASEDVDADSFDFRSFVDTALTKIEEAAASVDLKAKAENIGEAFSEVGTVFSLVEDILSDIDARMTEDGGEQDETVTEALDALSSIEETDEETLDDLLSSALLGIVAGEVDKDLDEGNKPEDIEIAIAIASFVFDTAKENEQIAAAVEATDSILFEKFDKSIEKLESHAAGNGAVNGDEVPEEPFEEYEEEFAEVEDYINEQGAPKQAALDILNLAHSIVDEIHFMVHGHTAAEVE
jgi:hypothetical protein